MRRQFVIMLLGLMTTLSLPAFAIAGSRENDHATQPYKYIGKELDRTHGLDWYDHGARHYDPVTGRWNVMDALAEKYYPWSPYVSCGDDPVNAVDPDGKEDYRVNKQGQFYKQKSMWEQIKSFFGCNTKKDRVFMEDTDEILAEFEEGTIMELEKQDIEFQNIFL